MKIITIALLFSLTFSIGCSTHNNNNNNNNDKEMTANEWSKDIDGLITHLNNWDKSELDAYERPDAHPNYVSSGETNGWIEEHKKQLKALGATVIWNKEKMEYVLNTSKKK